MLLVLCGAQCALFIDVSTITVCLPSIREALGIATYDIHWLVTSYAMPFGGLLLIGGRLADVVGPRRILVVGLAVFASATVGIALASSFAMLCAFRAIEGSASAMLAPAALSLTTRTFASEHDRLRAFAHYGTALAGGFACGALASGLLATISWRAAFVVNILLCLGVVRLALSVLPPDRPARKRPLNPTHVAIATSGALCLVYAAAQASKLGWSSSEAIIAGLGAIALLVAFRLLDARTRAPLIPPRLLTRARRTAMTAALLSAATGGSAQFVATTYLQGVLRDDARTTGAAVSALGVAALAAGPMAPHLSARIGTWGLLATGLGVEAMGGLVLAASTMGGGAGAVAAAMATIGLGLVLATIAYTDCALRGGLADADGVMTALLRSSEQVGGALGLAIVAGLAGPAMHSAALAAAAFSFVAASVTPELLRREARRAPTPRRV